MNGIFLKKSLKIRRKLETKMQVYKSPCERFLYQIIKVKDILTFFELLKSPTWKGIIPIVYCRAKSLVENPNASPEDPALFVYYTLDSECICYTGVLPCILRIGNKDFKIFFASTGFLKEEYRGTGFTKWVVSQVIEQTHSYFIIGVTIASQEMFNNKKNRKNLWLYNKDLFANISSFFL